MKLRILAPLAAALLALAPLAAAQPSSPEGVLRWFAGDAGIALVDCPSGGERRQLVLCGAYAYDFDLFRLDVDAALTDLVALGEWTDADGTLLRTFVDPAAPTEGLYHVGFRNGAVLLAYSPRGA